MTTITLQVRGAFTVEFNYKAGKMWTGIPEAYELQAWADRHNFEIVRLELIEEADE